MSDTEGDASCTYNTSFAVALEALGAAETIRIVGNALKPATPKSPSLRDQACSALQFLGDSRDPMRKISLTAKWLESSSAAEVVGGPCYDVVITQGAIESLEDIHNVFSSTSVTGEETHRAVLALSQQADKNVIIALMLFFDEFFPTSRLALWLRMFLNTISVSNAYMLRLVHAEFPQLLHVISQLVHAGICVFVFF